VTSKTQSRKVPLKLLWAERAKRKFEYFLDYVWITEPRPDGSNAHIKFEKWDHILDAAVHLQTERYLVVPKPRQIGWSWLVAALALWKTAFNRNFKVLLMSQGELEAYDLLAKVVYIWTHLPPELKPERNNDSRATLEFGPEWWIRALPSTAKAGHGTTAGLVIADEADYHEYLEQSYSAIKPTIDDVGGQFILISKCNPLKPQSLFKKIARGAPYNGFKCLFYPWDVRSNRTADWYEEVRKTYTDPFEFQLSYPGSLEEALEPPAQLRVLTGELLAQYRRESRPPIREDGELKIWQDWVPGRRYIAASDVAHGIGLDKSVTVLLEATSGIIVAALSSRTQAPLDFAVNSLALLREYGNPTWIIEVNDWGIRVADRAQALRYPRLFFRTPGNVGWKTTEATRPLMWGALLEAVMARTLITWDEELIDELANLIKVPDKGGRIEASTGSNDDYCTAAGMVFYNRDYASSQNYNPAETAVTVRQKKGAWKWR